MSFLTEVCGAEDATITDQSRLSDFEVESLELVALIQELQKRFEVALNDERLLGLDTVGQLIDLVMLRIAPDGQPLGDRAAVGD